MAVRPKQLAFVSTFAALAITLVAICLMVGLPAAAARDTEPRYGEPARTGGLDWLSDSAIPAAPAAPCAGGPTIDGILLTDCVVESFTVGGDNKSVTVWYTTTVNAPGHWINTDNEAQDVATWGREAWESFHTTFGRHPYDTGCGGNIDVKLELSPCGAAGCAYWASPGNCWIGIDAAMIRTGGGQTTVYHEFQHYLQYAYNSGCYADFRAHYHSGAAHGNAEYFEGYADVASDSVDATVDAWYYGNVVASYDPTTSFFDKSYFDAYNKYYLEQLGSTWTPAQPRHHMDAVRDHYAECDVQNTIYVLDTLIPTLSGGARSQESLFLDFFAANWAKDWADASTQPELVYTDDDGNPYGQIPLAHDVNLTTGSQSWTGAATPDDWAGRYYQVKPQAGCDYVTVDVDGAAGARLGINLMAADTTAPTSVSRSGWIGEDFSRTFPGDGVHDRVAASINAFATTGGYDISFECVTPVIDLIEPKPKPNHSKVGEPASPIAVLSRFKVTSGGAPVRGLSVSAFSAEAEGDAVSFVPGTFQEVGEEYWVVVTPPTKPAGTTYVDMEVCLDTTICDTNTDALHYEDPGNTDFAMVFDASGSMDTEDIAGEGKRVDNAKKAGTVMADLLQGGDRILVTDFSALDNPAGCGLPHGTGNCTLDLQTYLARRDVVVPTTIDQTKNAIDLISARAWTPIGAALRDAKDKLLASPDSGNPKVIVLLSDGEENVNPLYSAVKTELKDSGVIIDTIAFSSEADETLMSQIAADTGGVYRFVPTTGASAASLSVQQVGNLLALGLPPEYASRMAGGWLPGPLALDNVYDYFETTGQGASRLLHASYTGTPDNTWKTQSQYVDDSVNRLRMVVAGKQEDALGCGGYHRDVEILPPGGDPQEGWIPVSPPESWNPPPTSWDSRHSYYDDVVIITNPTPGSWSIRTRYRYTICRAGRVDERAAAAMTPESNPSDFLMNASVESDFRLLGRFLPPVVDNQGSAGDVVPIVATLLSRSGGVPGAILAGTIEKPGGSDTLWLYDDGAHADGGAGDGIYGTLYGLTDVGGSYNTRLLAVWEDPSNPGNYLSREWLGAFWIEGPEANDGDEDGMPDPWEDRCDLDTDRDDTQEDLDNDGLTNGEEFRHGTLPCDPDTDDGGEQDGSEVRAGRNALEPSDDLCSPLGRVRMRALDQGIGINWPRPDDFSEMYLHLSTSAGELGQRYTIPATGEFELAQLANDQTYYVTLAGVNEDAICDYAETEEVIPKEDPDPPYGWILINSGAEATFSRDVLLNLSASDEAADGAVTMPGILTKGPVDVAPASVNDDLEMRISNDPSLEGAAWEPLSSEKPWNLGDTAGRIATVHAQFRDEAGNESTVVVDNIYLETGLYISPTATTIGISDTVTVDVIAGNVEALYGVEFHLSFDPDVVQVEDAIPGGDVNVIPGDFLDPGAVVHQNYVNNGTGEVEYVQTRQGAVEGVGGSGVLARIVFHGKAFGTSTLTFTLHTLSDPLSVPIEHTAGSGEVTVGVPTGAVRGKVVLERRVDYPNANAGATVELAGRSLLIGSDGNYNFTGVPEGTHQISATHPSYLPAWRTIEVVTGATTDVPTVTLLGGDCSVAPQGQISGEDSVAMALAWGSTPSDPHWSARADIRDDNSIDVLDFVAVKFNWRATAPGPWPAVAAASHVAQAPPAPGPAAPQSPAVASVVLTPTVITISLGTPATVDIWVHDVTDLYGAGFLLQFDPEVVGVEDANPFEDGVQIESGSWLQRQLEAANSVDDAAGEVDFFVTQSYPEPAKSGSGLLARITLTGLANGSSVLHFESIQLVDDEETILAASSQDGEVVVTGEHRVFLPVVLRGAEG